VEALCKESAAAASGVMKFALIMHIAAWMLATVFACGVLHSALAAPADTSHPFSSGTHKVLVDQRVSGIRRSYYVHVPAGYSSSAPLPVVVALHGAFSTALKFERESGLSLLADREGFLVVYPQGIGFGDWFRHWNSGYCCGKARRINLDDVGFVLAAVDDVARRSPVDRARLYVVGFSNGGMLAYRIAAEHPGIIAAVAVVSGTIGGTSAPNEPEWSITPPKRPVAVLAIHGLADANIPFEGGRGAQSHGGNSAISVARSMRFWVDADHCSAQPQVESLAQGRAELQSWSGCRDDTEVVLYSLKNWGHEWPKENLLGGFDAAGTIWRFFERHRLTSDQHPTAADDRRQLAPQCAVRSTSTQSGSPALLFPGVAKFRLPELVNGAPLTSLDVPLVGSYHCAVTLPLNLAMLTVSVVRAGQ
jgi:polyhydroxybutyrate depolymerase